MLIKKQTPSYWETKFSFDSSLKYSVPMIEVREKKLVEEYENLLFKVEKEDDKEEKNETVGELAPHLKSKIWLQLVHDQNVYNPA